MQPGTDHLNAPHAHPGRRVRSDQPFVGRGLRDAWAHFNAELLAGIQQRYPAATVAMNQVMILVDGEGTTVAELARRAGMTKQAMGESVANLEAIGLVERVPHPSDRRARLVVLTPEGWAAIRTGYEIAMSIDQRWQGLLGPDAMAELVALLDRLVDALDAASATTRTARVSPSAGRS